MTAALTADPTAAQTLVAEAAAPFSAAAGAQPGPAPGGEGATPAMAQYFALKAEAGEALLFFRMGDFYELFFADAEAAAPALDIALTRRGKHGGNDIPMCGVPVGTAEMYLARLVAAGFKVAIAEQTEDPKTAKRRDPKAPVPRAIVRVVTPGTVTEEALLDGRAAAWLAAVATAPDGAPAALAWADPSTGVFRVASLATTATAASSEGGAAGALAAHLAALAPREVLAPPALWLGDLGASAVLAGGSGVRTDWPPKPLTPGVAQRRLEAAFGVGDLSVIGSFEPAEIVAAGLLVDYLALTQAGGPLGLGPPERMTASDRLALDPATRASLEILRTQRGERAGSLLATLDRTVTAPGARRLAERLAEPSTDPGLIAARLDAAGFFVEAARLRLEVRAHLKSTGDPARAAGRLALGRGGPRDLVALARSLAAAEAVVGAATGAGAPPPAARSAFDAASLAGRPALARLGSDIARSLSPEPPVLARDGDFILPGVDAGLDAARALRDDARRVVAGLQAQYAETAGVPGLKVKYNAQLGYFIEVTGKHADRLLETRGKHDFVHRQTMANAARFTTEELSRLDAEISTAGERARGREAELFDAFVERVRAGLPAIREVADALADLDVFAALADWAEATGAVRPEVDASLVFDVEAGRHPVVETALGKSGAAFTPNDCRLDGAGSAAPRLLVVTGPNMAGKSTFLRQNALFVILAQAGAFVPARRARIGVVDRLFSRVGAADDLSRGRSTFMAEMLETAAILRQAGPRSLVILDEVGRGTSTFDGLAIAWACVEHLHDVNAARALFATHYHELTDLAERLPAAANASLKAKAWKGDLVFLHAVSPGPADRSYGVDVAKRAGVPPAVVARARAVLARLETRAGAARESLADLPLFAGEVLGPGAAPPPPEPSPREAALLDRLACLDPDTLAPREALEALYALRQIAGLR